MAISSKRSAENIDLDDAATLELFPGSKHWSLAHKEAGFKAQWHCWHEDPKFDMTDPSYVYNDLIPMIVKPPPHRKRRFVSLQIGIECTTYSTMTGSIYRTKCEPEGTSQALAHPRRGPKVRNANLYSDHGIDAWLAADSVGTFASIENPQGSRLWHTKRMKPLMQRVSEGSLWLCKTSFCKWGRPFRGTRWVLANYPEIMMIERHCTHTTHAGILAAHSIPTQEANPYPKALCRQWAQITKLAMASRGGQSLDSTLHSEFVGGAQWTILRWENAAALMRI